MSSQILLTQFSKGSGCGCKIAPAILEKLLPKNSENNFPNLLVGYENRDDAAVFETENGKCIISTTDFFTPIVDDPFDFGRIAAANAISDIYAMGGKPLMALGILGWPTEKISPEVAKQVIEGGKSICAEAGIPLAGGHSIDIPEPVFGLAVTGEVEKNNLKKNNTAFVGDIIFITKPIGSGILSAALKRGLLSDEQKKLLVRSLVRLNSIGKLLGEKEFVTAMTDLTGFGLLGHLIEMTSSSNLSAVIEKNAIPVMDDFSSFAAQFIYPENTTRNYSAYLERCEGMNDLDFLLLCDPQTNGGLIFTARPESKSQVFDLFKSQKQDLWEIGRIIFKGEKPVVFV